MRREGHIGLNMVLASPIIAYLGFVFSMKHVIVFGVIMFFMSPLPDIDIKLGRIPFVPITHRGITHTVWFALILGGFFSFLIYRLEYSSAMIIVGFLGGFIGITGHLLGDLVTPTGINYTPPITSSKTSLNLFYYDNWIANLGFPLVSIITLVTAIDIATKTTITEIDVLLFTCVYILCITSVLVSGWFFGFRMDNTKSMWFTKYASPSYIIKKILK